MENQKSNPEETGKKKTSIFEFLFGWMKPSPKEEPIKTENEDGSPRDPAEIEAEEKARKEAKANAPKQSKAGMISFFGLLLAVIAVIVLLFVFANPFSSKDGDGKEKAKTEQAGNNNQPGSGNNNQPGSGNNNQPGGGNNNQPGGGNNTQPIVQIEVPASNGQYNWSNVDQDMLKKAYTTNPDLKGETVLLVYLVKDYVDANGKTQDMIWIQTDQGSGPVRNIFTEATKVK
ncbi:MAG: hypothetical protein WAZ12_04350 [Candidatus Absconditicoccaceae bacterium]